MKAIAAASLLPVANAVAGSPSKEYATVSENRMHGAKIRALLISATTLAGKGSLEHAREHLQEIYGAAREILLINFASLPEDRDAYEARMQRDFRQIDPSYRVTSLHRAAAAEAGEAIRSAEGFFVSGGNTFLLLRELYDRYVVELLRERVLDGVPYAGSSAGANIAGIVIGTTNDFPLTDVPTRRSLGILAGVYNPHHPDPREDKPGFDSRQWKIGQYARYHANEAVIGVTNPGMIRIEGECCSLLGEDAIAFVRQADRSAEVYSKNDGSLEAALKYVSYGA